jgi:hypothetical protein
VVATVLADVGFRTVNLGPNTPLEVLGQSAKELGADLVWVSLTAPLPKAPLADELARLDRRLARRQTPLVLGGRSAGRYKLPDSRNLHAFATLSEMAGFAAALLKSRGKTV